MQALFVSTQPISSPLAYAALMHPGGRPSTRPKGDLGNRISQTRIQAGLSQAALAEKLGITQQAVAALERRTNGVRSDTLTKLASAIGVSTEELLGNNTPRSKTRPVKGKLLQVFEAVAKLPRRQQEKVAEFVEAYVERQIRTANGSGN